MEKKNRNLDVDLDYSKIRYEDTNESGKIEAIDLEAAEKLPSKSALEISGKSGGGKKPVKPSCRSGREKAGKSKIRKQSAVGIVVIMLLFALLLVVMVQGRVENSRISGEIADLRRELSALESERKELNSKIDAATDMRVLEDYATANGLVYSADVENVYVGSDGEDDVEVYEPDEELFGGVFGTLLSAISESILKAWNTISGADIE